jgi:hypothetical protein
MSKRIIAAILGAIAVFASLIPFGYAFEIFRDFKNPDVSFRVTVLGGLLISSIALTALIIGIRFLRFAGSGRDDRSSSWVRPLLLGVGSFFPGFLFSLPLTILWANHTWPGDGQSVFAAIEVSVYVGLATAVICSILLWKKSRSRHIP